MSKSYFLIHGEVVEVEIHLDEHSKMSVSCAEMGKGIERIIYSPCERIFKERAFLMLERKE